MEEPKPYLTRAEAAELLNVSVQSVDRWIASGQLEAFKPSLKLTRIRRADIEALFTHNGHVHVQEVPDA